MERQIKMAELAAPELIALSGMAGGGGKTTSEESSSKKKYTLIIILVLLIVGGILLYVAVKKIWKNVFQSGSYKHCY